MENSGIPLVDDEPVARSRLAALLGEAEANRMIERFFQALGDAIAAIDGGEALQVHGHRIGGLAGTMGFAGLSAAWLALQEGDDSWLAVRAGTLAAITCHKRRDAF